MAYESKYRREDIDELFDGILTLRDREDMYYKRDTFNRSEIAGG